MKPFPVKRDDSYEEMAATYQVLEIARLNDQARTLGQPAILVPSAASSSSK